ncbi:uncharacterized protein LOC141644248 [Silene latifolia]|uniref:uncharacterized protein LOC141644248 n=1 Tax=Silene latifolia TaxID=37657 RepID=UPI003D770906
MGNCQAVDAAALVIQHPNGKVDRMYWAVKANEVMKLNPGHYVSLIIPLPVSDSETAETGDHKKTVRYTRVKLLRPTDTLILGHAYRLLTSQEVKKVMRAKKLAKEKNTESSADKLQINQEKKTAERAETEKNDEGSKQDRKLRSGSMNSRSKTWRPSLQSISETVN